MARIVAVSVALLVASAALGAAQEPGPDDEKKESPITKVVNLIKDLKSKIEADGKAETKLYNRYACWCESTTARKANGIHQAFQDIKSYGTKVLESKGSLATRESEIADVSRLIRDNQKSQDSATAIREKENGLYESQKAEMEQTLASLEKAIKTLMGAGTSLVQDTTNDQLFRAAAQVHVVLEGLPDSNTLSPKSIALLRSFARSGSSNPASGTIQGILKDMYDTFTQNLEKAVETEATSQKNYENLMSVKTKEMQTLSGEKSKKEEEKAAFESDEADAAQSLDDTQKQMKADTQLFDEVKASCSTKASQWNERVRARTEELHGVNKALEILTSDDSRALFKKSIKPGFAPSLLQVSEQQLATDPRTKAWKILKAHATKANSLRLATVASHLRLGGHFDGVIASIDEMMNVLKGEEKDDIEQRDWCKEETFKNEQEAARFKYKIEKHDAKISKLQLKVEDLETASEKTIAAIADTTGNIASMEQQRIDDHKVYESTKADDEAAAGLLGIAIEALSSFHGKSGSEDEATGSLLQRRSTRQPEFDVNEDATPDATFSDSHKNSEASGGIVALMKMIKEDLENESAFGTKTEIASQTQFEKELKSAKALKADLLAKKINLEADITEKTKQITDIEVIKEGDEELLQEEKEYLASIKPDCDFMLKAFENRRESRSVEMKGLFDAKSTLLGASSSSFLQRN